MRLFSLFIRNFASSHRIRGLAIFSMLLAAYVGTWAQQSQAPAPAPKAVQRASDKTTSEPKEKSVARTIRGRVTEGGRPVADATIICLPTNWNSDPQSLLSSMLRPLASDADGKFEIRDLPRGAYSISASAPGYVTADADSERLYRSGDDVRISLTRGAVITGRVTDSSGNPVIGARVKAMRLRGSDNRRALPVQDASPMAMMSSALAGDWKTDDRGIYRIYGLVAGTYNVCAGGRGLMSMNSATPYDGDAPTYYPSSTPDGATDVTLRPGEEAVGIDIRYRELRGHAISGKVSSASRIDRSVSSVLLARVSGGAIENTTYLRPGGESQGFEFVGVSDGDYTVSAFASPPGLPGGTDIYAAQPVRVTVKGADVSGVEIALAPLASIEGRVAVEPPQEAQKGDCKSTGSSSLQEIVLATAGDRALTESPIALFLGASKNATPNEKGEFTLQALSPGLHHLSLQIPGEQLYVKSIALPPSTATGKPVDAAVSGLTLKAGDKLRGLIVTMREGAASLRGKVTLADSNAPIALRMHLVPAETEAANDVLRYAETEVAADGNFSLLNLAPGKYWLVAREATDQEQTDADYKLVAWDASGRTALRFEGDATKKVVELSRCQRVNDFVFNYLPLIKPTQGLPKTPPKRPTL
jgi:protocatechuate 3,4-dioxygenase beta subunit